MIPSVESYVKRVVETIEQFAGRIQSAPSFARGRDMFGQKIQAKWQLKNERAECLKAISEEASMFGYDLGTKFVNLTSMTKTHEEPVE